MLVLGICRSKAIGNRAGLATELAIGGHCPPSDAAEIAKVMHSRPLKPVMMRPPVVAGRHTRGDRCGGRAGVAAARKGAQSAALFAVT